MSHFNVWHKALEFQAQKELIPTAISRNPSLLYVLQDYRKITPSLV